MLRRFDEWLLYRADDLVLWVWNRFSIEKIIIVRVLLIAYVVLELVSAALSSDLSIRIWTWVWAPLMLLVHFWVEVQYRSSNRSTHNLVVMMKRESVMGLILRLSMLTLFLLSMITNLALLSADGTMAEFLLKATLRTVSAAYFYVSDSFAPTEPPERKTKEVELPQTAGVLG